MREPHDPFDVLGVASSADEQALRAAFRAHALRHHPDRNPGDPAAADRFKRILLAYGEALRCLRGETPIRRGRAEPPVGRWLCTGCGDRFVVSSSCPRCEIELTDSNRGVEARARVDAKLDDWAVALERKAARVPRFDGLGRYAPALIAAAFFLMGAAVYHAGPVAPALMCASFGTWVALIEAHARWRSLLFASA